MTCICGCHAELPKTQYFRTKKQKMLIICQIDWREVGVAFKLQCLRNCTLSSKSFSSDVVSLTVQDNVRQDYDDLQRSTTLIRVHMSRTPLTVLDAVSYDNHATILRLSYWTCIVLVSVTMTLGRRHVRIRQSVTSRDGYIYIVA